MAHPKPTVLSERCKSVLAYIVDFKRQNDGLSPTIREISAATGITSTSVVNYYLDALEAAGLITRQAPTPYSARQIRVVGGQWTYQQS